MRYVSCGESHGEGLMGILEGFPSNLALDINFINEQLRKRQAAYGRSERMKIEVDEVNFISGVNNGKTTGNPIGIYLKNRGLNVETKEVLNVRPGHGDLVGAIKYNQKGARNILERASARETAIRVALGSICQLFLRELGIEISSHIIEVGKEKSNFSYYNNYNEEKMKNLENSSLRIVDSEFEERAILEIDRAKDFDDSLGGKFEIIIKNLVIGIGSHTSWEEKLDGLLAQGIMSIQAIKSVEIGLGEAAGSYLGSEFHDPIYFDAGVKRRSNNAGGIEAGISNGEDIVIRASMKPIPTTVRGIESINLETKESVSSAFERSDFIGLTAASIVGESVAAFIIAREVLRKIGGDSMEEVLRNYSSYLSYVGDRLGY